MLLSIDPGVNNAGLVVVDYTTDFVVIESNLVKNARKFTESEKAVEAKYNSRVVKVQAILAKMTDILDRYPTIDTIAIEAPFYNHLTPAAYGSLLEVISAVIYTIILPRGLKYKLIEPMLVKKFFANKHMASKEVIKEFLIAKKKDGSIKIDIDIETMSEHEIDGVAIGYSYMLQQIQTEE